MDKLKVLFHVNDPERWQRALLNIDNFINDQGQDRVMIEVVANGGAVVAYSEESDGGLHDDMSRLFGMGVGFAACRNALGMHVINEKTLPPFVRVVPAGITEIAVRQVEGYAYIKP